MTTREPDDNEWSDSKEVLPIFFCPVCTEHIIHCKCKEFEAGWCRDCGHEIKPGLYVCSECSDFAIWEIDLRLETDS